MCLRQKGGERDVNREIKALRGSLTDIARSIVLMEEKNFCG